MGNFSGHHAFLCRLHLERIDQLKAAIAGLSARIEEEMRPFAHQLELLETIPGVGRITAEVIIAETGGDMTRSAPPDTSPPGPESAPATTNPPGRAEPARLVVCLSFE
nr:transposase [Actinacidiphila soli]